MMDFIKELIDFIGEISSGKLDAEKARKRAAELQAKAAEHMSDDLLAELDRKIKVLGE